MTRQKELEKLEKLLRDRRGKEHTLKRLSTKCQTLKSNDRLIATIEAEAEQAYSSFKTLHEEILRLCEEEQFDQHFETFDQLSDLYESIKSQCAELSPQSSQQTPTPTPSEQCPPSLYKPLDLPTFNGKEEHWPSFASLFKAKIDSDVRLSGAQKLEYLSCSLRGPVVDLIRHLDFTNEAYEQAWQLLTRRYEHKRRLVLAHASRLLNQAPETDEPGSLQSHIDTSDECLRALKAIRPKVDIENALLIQIIIQKLTLDTIEEWEKSLPDDEIPPFETLLEFLRRRARILESRHRQSYFPQNMPKPRDKPPDGTTSKLTETKLSCPVCKGNHFTTQCHKFSALTVPEKLDLVHKKNLCSNCLSHKHITRQCRAGNCRKCYQRHHTSLHQDLQRPQNLHMTSPSPTSSVLLSTALVEITDNTGKTHTARALVDSGAQSNFISTELFKKLKLPKASSSLTFQGLGATQLGQTQGTVQITLSSPIQPDLRLHAEMHIIPHITAQLPTLPVDTTKWSYLNRVKLADPTFHIPGKIELLLGAGIYRNILKGGIIEDCAEYPIAQDTKLGWIVMGQLNQSLNESLTHHSLTLDDTMKRFWELENIPSTPHYSPEEIQCEQHFQNSVQRLHGGRYQVKLPFHETPNLGESRVQAIVRFKNLERKLQKDCATEMAYRKVIHDYCELGHMEPVPKDELLNSPSAYLPHHGVFKDSTTTKLRVVFDASAKTSNNRSLNDAMLKGPKLQEDIFNILLRFRSHNIAVTADIEKMYRQINIHPNERDFQRIVWRDHPSMPIQDFRLTTVTFGVKAAPYLAIRTLNQLAEDEKENYPLVSNRVKTDFYVDDLLSGASSLNEAELLVTDMTKLMSAGGFKLQKWASNCPEVLKEIPVQLKQGLNHLNINPDDCVPTLGLQWIPQADDFVFSIQLKTHKLNTKRSLLSDAASIFDPLGWLAPITVTAKIMFQKLWLTILSWDDALPAEVESKWSTFKFELNAMLNLRIPRRLFPFVPKCVTICGFADSSELAYGAVVYIRTESESGNIEIRLAAAKTKVAPLKTVSLPRLELCAALLLAKLMQAISISLSIESKHAWTDSTVTLAWISASPSEWKTFVANRVAEIQDLVSPSNWHHVKGSENPADIASRGLFPSQLPTCNLWWSGPPFLRTPDFTASECPAIARASPALSEKRKPFTFFVTIDLSILERFSSHNRLVRVTARIKRMAQNKRRNMQIKGPLSVEELKNANFFWIKTVQKVSFSQDIQNLNENKSLHAKSKLHSLAPFLDEMGLLRVGGRIINSSLTPDRKFPILLPKGHHLTEIIIRDMHNEHLHAGPQLLTAIIREQYWVPNLRNIVRKVIHRCTRCFRLKAQGVQQIMGQLPQARVSPSRPFFNCGIDFAGPIKLRTMLARGSKLFKAYIAVFVCFSTKAIHLEAVSSLSTAAFIAALKRFISRRGKPKSMFSDNGTNFVGADRELAQLLKQATADTNDPSVIDYLSTQGIQWHFIPPGAPHFGGLWEAGVKSTKHHLKRVIGETQINFEELSTVLASIEACLNSRPISELSSDPNDLSALTPGHFLIGAPLTSHPEPSLLEVKDSRLSRWQLLQKMSQHFWTRWSQEYLARLQQRPKWSSSGQELNVGQLVLIKDDNLPPLKWKLGRVDHLHPGNDGITRVVTLRTTSGHFKRPVCKICPLPDNDAANGNINKITDQVNPTPTAN